MPRRTDISKVLILGSGSGTSRMGMSFLRVGVMVAFASCLAFAQKIEWKEPSSLSCAQIKVEGKRLNKVKFKVYRAANANQECCDLGPAVFEGRTSTFGHFDVPIKFEEGGHYWLVFLAKAGDIKVPVKMRGNFRTKNCEMRDAVFNLKKDGSIKLDEWVTVD